MRKCMSASRNASFSTNSRVGSFQICPEQCCNPESTMIFRQSLDVVPTGFAAWPVRRSCCCCSDHDATLRQRADEAESRAILASVISATSSNLVPITPLPQPASDIEIKPSHMFLGAAETQFHIANLVAAKAP